VCVCARERESDVRLARRPRRRGTILEDGYQEIGNALPADIASYPTGQ
jgi:hypothetical protein